MTVGGWIPLRFRLPQHLLCNCSMQIIFSMLLKIKIHTYILEMIFLIVNFSKKARSLRTYYCWKFVYCVLRSFLFLVLYFGSIYCDLLTRPKSSLDKQGLFGNCTTLKMVTGKKSKLNIIGWHVIRLHCNLFYRKIYKVHLCYTKTL